MNLRNVVIASQNKHKIEEINEILKEFNMVGLSLKDVGLASVEVIEDGLTFEENSYKKAYEIMKLTKKITLADDSGLEVKALNWEPGVFSARYAGDNATDEDNNEKLMKALEGVAFEDRDARYVSVITMIYPDGRKLVARGEVKGKIALEKSGDKGFGYDPYFIPEGYDKTFGCFEMDEKNKISHRGEALIKLRDLIESEERK